MSLPKIEAPTFTMNLTSIKKPVTYRPFLVKEEKLLLMAMEGGEQEEIVRTSKQIINNCILSEEVNAEELPLFDLQMALLNIRAKSVGEVVELMIKHREETNSNGESCDAQTKVKINLADIKLTTNDKHSKNIKLTDTITVEMKYPTMEVYNRLADMENEKTSTVAELFSIVIDCIDNIYSGEEVFNAGEYNKEELEEFISSLSSDQFEKLKLFFGTMPAILHDIEFTCSKCKCHEKQTLNGIGDFFL